MLFALSLKIVGAIGIANGRSLNMSQILGQFRILRRKKLHDGPLVKRPATERCSKCPRQSSQLWKHGKRLLCRECAVAAGIPVVCATPHECHFTGQQPAFVACEEVTA